MKINFIKLAILSSINREQTNVVFCFTSRVCRVEYDGANDNEGDHQGQKPVGLLLLEKVCVTRHGDCHSVAGLGLISQVQIRHISVFVYYK